MEEKIYVNSEERVCRVTLNCEEGSFTGIATCSEADKFDTNRGLDLAYKRALLQVKQADIKQFQEEVKSYDDQIRELLEVAKRYTKARRKLFNAKACQSALYREIEALTKTEMEEVTESV